jgi:hypothetical protein
MATTTGHIVTVHFTKRLHSWIGDLILFRPFGFIASFDFLIIRFWAYLMKVIPEMHTKFDISIFIDGMLNCRYTAQFM